MAQHFSPFDLQFETDKVLSFPLAGGMNSPIFSEIDLNLDGIKDLFVFDLTGQKYMTFLYDEASSEYKYDSKYEKLFPISASWVLLRDYDGDGIEDLFTQEYQNFTSGIAVYKGLLENASENASLTYERIDFGQDNLLVMTYLDQNNESKLLYAAESDLPVIADVDSDGDLDVLTFGLSPIHIKYYKNYAVESDFPLDSIFLFEEDLCWGGFLENGGDSVLFAGFPGDCAVGKSPSEKHGASSLAIFDQDNDGDSDLLLGEIANTYLNFLTNKGDADLAFFDEQSFPFPNYDIGTDLSFNPAASFIDVDHDGMKDMLVSPFSKQDNSENYLVNWYYRNLGPIENQQFSLQKKDFLIDEMLDFGSNSSPALVDLNGDGKMDLIIGNSGFQNSLNGTSLDSASLFYFENTSENNVEIKFKLVNPDLAGLSTFNGIGFLAPTFGDLDGDGDSDLLLGTNNGKIIFCENTGNSSMPEFESPVINYLGLGEEFVIGQNLAPQIVDANKDGLLDILIGEMAGNINFFSNIGTATNPQFNPNPNASVNKPDWGGIDESISGFSNTSSAPFYFELNEMAFVINGGKPGSMNLYSRPAEQVNTEFQMIEEKWGGIDIGQYSRPLICDFNGDGLFEILSGTKRGGLKAYQSDLNLNGIVAINEADINDKIIIAPNPFRDKLTVSGSAVNEISKLSIFNLNGQVVWQSEKNFTKKTIDLKDLKSGIYFVHCYLESGGFSVQKVLKVSD